MFHKKSTYIVECGMPLGKQGPYNNGNAISRHSKIKTIHGCTHFTRNVIVGIHLMSDYINYQWDAITQ